MLKDPITILVMSMVTGPDGKKLKPGKIYEYEDSARLRILVKSGTVSLIDPPSLDPEFLEKAGYELQEGYEYPIKEPEKKTQAAPKKKVSEEITSNEKSHSNKSDSETPLQLTPPVGMGVKESVENTPIEGNNNDGTGDNNPQETNN